MYKAIYINIRGTRKASHWFAANSTEAARDIARATLPCKAVLTHLRRKSCTIES